MLKDIDQFHRKFELPRPSKPQLLDAELAKFRIRFMQEELDEFIYAHQTGDLAEALDALVDLTYVVLGTAWLMNLPFDKAWDAVHTANMKKVRATSHAQSKRQTLFDVVKPPGWTAPDINKVIDEYQLELPLEEMDQSKKV